MTRPRSKFVGSISECTEPEEGYVTEKSSQIKGPSLLRHCLASFIKKLPRRIKCFLFRIPSASRSEREYIASVRPESQNIIECSYHISIPSTHLGLFKGQRDSDGWQFSRVTSLFRAVNVLFSETSPPLAPTT